jgi:hypothetical protein
MSRFFMLVPGYVTLPGLYGPDNLANVFGFAWTDQQGLRAPTGVTFRGLSGRTLPFHIPFTTPTIFGTTAATATRLNLLQVAVTFACDSGVSVDRIRVFDRVNATTGGSPPLDTGAPPAALGLTGSAFVNSWVPGSNHRTLSPPHSVDGSISITVDVRFGVEGNVRFTGAGAVFDG